MSERIGEIIEKLRERYHREVNEDYSPFQILISTILSQRTKDANTSKASKRLFSKYKTAKDVAEASLSEIKKLIKPSGFYNEKAKNVKETSEILVEEYEGKVPRDREDMMDLPGVGPKTSGIVIVYGFGERKAIPVDVHVKRISNRIGLVDTRKPVEVEQRLKQITPKKYWIPLNHLFVEHGQQTCKKTNPKCKECVIRKYCDHFKES